jgi:hypothetical protein
VTMVARLLAARLGAWLVAAPAVLGYAGATATSDHIAGPLVVGTSLPAAWPVLRELRWMELVAGAWLLVAPWLSATPADAIVAGIATGLVLAKLSFAGGEAGRRFDGGWRAAGRLGSRSAG